MGQPYESILVETKEHVAQVTLIGPGKGNAMGPAFWRELPEVFASLDADPDVRAIVLTGSGRNFSYGLDLPAMGGTLAPVLADGAMAGPRTEFHREVMRMQGTISAVADCRTPTIASTSPSRWARRWTIIAISPGLSRRIAKGQGSASSRFPMIRRA